MSRHAYNYVLKALQNAPKPAIFRRKMKKIGRGHSLSPVGRE